IGDVTARFKRLQGFNVLYPMGWDAFGMPAENAAIKNKTHPAEWTKKNIADMRAQLSRMGFSYDWSREIATCLPEYYRWEQEIFIRMWEKGLAYKKESLVNWCPSCQTVLANEQVENGLCWRCENLVTKKPLSQWFFKITDYAEELLEKTYSLLGWPEKVLTMQREWIGKSVGARLSFELEGIKEKIEVFTTRPDTLYGVSFVSVALEHPLLKKLSLDPQVLKSLEALKEKVRSMDRQKQLSGDYEKEGVDLKTFVLHPLTGEKLPLYAANFVLMDYGTGAVMAVPAHDQRDFDFAKKYHLPIRVVIEPETGLQETLKEAYTQPGLMKNSGTFDGKNSEEAKLGIVDLLESQGLGKKEINYRLRDWGISRQRYWGTPIPMIYCESCGLVPEKLENLPVELPIHIKFSGEGGSPLAKLDSFVEVSCPQCGAKAKRETDTMDTFMESSWYFLRYTSPHYDQGPFDKKAAQYWMSVDQYIGGIEHAVLHLLYARFFTKVLRDLAYINVDEPFQNLLTQGMVIKDGAKMSKSKGNVVDPNYLIEKYGADTARLFSLFAAPPEKDLDWSDSGVEGAYRFLRRLFAFVTQTKASSEAQKEELQWQHKTIKKVTQDLERFHFNTAVAALMEFFNFLSKSSQTTSRESLKTLVILIAPFTPHLAEELWQSLGESGDLSKQSWPSYDEALAKEDLVTLAVQISGKVRAKLQVSPEASEQEVLDQAMADPKIESYLAAGELIKKIYVPGKILNLVVKAKP
ncbi:MAG: leucine--tRNA ligase, partial [Deltaproteobacteria bacterium]|nr:leucine--tRNA ligase [Deltaproteobacteria bacterium]